MKNILIFIASLCLFLTARVSAAQAFDSSKLGVHILNVHELEAAKRLVSPSVLGASTQIDYQHCNYVTIPITLDDLTAEKKIEWQAFFDQAKVLKIIPIIRLTTRFSLEKNVWVVPNKKQIIDQINFLSSLNWPTNKMYLIAYNEVNHAAEWGGRVDPAGYAKTLKFVSNWAHTEGKEYVILPAAMDLAAANTARTWEAFHYLSQLYAVDPEIFSYIDVWNSHSYPNPGFASSPTRYGKNSLRGFENELSFLADKTGRNFQVMITETGWQETPYLSRWLESYYTYAMQHIWSDERVIAVTPFLLKGAPGPFAGFSFFDESNEPSNQFHSFRAALEKLSKEI